MKVSVETINGRECTVIHRNGDYTPDGAGFLKCTTSLGHEVYSKKSGAHLATTLPPLPRHPKPEDAPLLYRYASEGVIAEYRYEDHCGDEYILSINEDGFAGLGYCLAKHWAVSYVHAIDLEGNRVDVAITGGKDDD